MTRRVTIIIFALAIFIQGCRRGEVGTATPGKRAIGPDLLAKSPTPTSLEESCSGCHEREARGWLESQHASANRLLDDRLDHPAFLKGHEIKVGEFITRMTMRDGAPAFSVTAAGGETRNYEPEAVVGIEPLIQYLVSAGDGRLQAIDASYDTQRDQWFHVFAGEERFEHEWGYWRNRGMNWNAQCAACHMTGFEKHYDQRSDSYDSTWEAMGISCKQCHGDQTAHTEAESSGEWNSAQPAMSRIEHMQVCATCHARREALTGKFTPGALFDDHYRLSLATEGDAYYADGQVRDENYEYGSFLLSRLALKGVTCMNCHDPHSGKLNMPVSDNSLCMSCHTAPGWNGAATIDPLAHSHHASGSSGNRCVECHMPITKYMVRDPRRDHGFTVPDPSLTKELGIPNACNRCHESESTDWAIEWAEQWYGDKLSKRRSRKRARGIHDMRAGRRGATQGLVALAREEEIPAWRSALISLLSQGDHEETSRGFLTASLAHDHPLVRAAAVRALAPWPDSYPLLLPLRKDPSRLVRLDAIWATLHPLQRDSQNNVELMHYLAQNSDQPAGAARLAQLALTENRMDDATRWIDKALAWDPSAGTYHLKGRVYHAAERIPEAESAFSKAVELEPANADHHYALALLYGESERPRKALASLEATVRADPNFGRAWYNLGLARAALEQLEEAIEALRRAEALIPQSPEPAYARATVHLRLGDHDSAMQSLKAALEIQPNHVPALQLISTMNR